MPGDMNRIKSLAKEILSLCEGKDEEMEDDEDEEEEAPKGKGKPLSLAIAFMGKKEKK